MQSILTVLGARPQFIKAAPVSWALQDLNIKETIIHTGQHFDQNMSDIFFSELNIPHPNYRLNAGGTTPLKQIAQILNDLEAILEKETPDIVMIYGDTNTTLAGALAANLSGCKVVHVESGLRSWNRQMPEEINRILTDHTADFFVCPSQAAEKNLRAEGINRPVSIVGDTMFDVVLSVREKAGKSELVDQHNLKNQPFYLTTLHRPYNVDVPKRLYNILDGLNKLDARVILPLHPRTAKRISENPNIQSQSSFENITFTDPVGIIDMVALMSHAQVILTDSGGIQKEALFLDTPCVTIRPETEWIETVSSGWNVLCEPTQTEIQGAVALQKSKTGTAPHLYGDGNAGQQIANVLDNILKTLGSKDS